MVFKKLKALLLIGCLCFISLHTVGQINESSRYTYPEFKAEDANKLFFRLESNNFLKNDEYFGEFSEGYTLPGYSFEPSFMYYAGSNVRLKIGVHAFKYDGLQEFSEVIPVVSIHTQLSKTWDMILGNLKGSVHHRLIEPIFNSEWQYFRPQETGVQFIHQSPKLFLDTWVDWEQFIFHGDDIPEKFTGGISAEYLFSDSESTLKISLPFQFLASHLGGQISNYDIESYSLVNMVTGLKFQKEIQGAFINKLSFTPYVALYNDLTDAKGLPFKMGYAFYPTAVLAHKHGEIMLAYWKSSDWYALKGTALFHSVSDHEAGIYAKDRQLLNTKFTFSKQLMKKVTFNAQFETYFDPDASQFDYAYGISVVFTPNFFITNLDFE